MRRLQPPTLVSMWMLDVFCCALGCVTLLWLLKTREAGEISDEASQAASLVAETRGQLDEANRIAALRLANAEKLSADVDSLNKRLALMRQERDENAKHLALAEEELAKTKQDLVAARTRVDDLETMTAGLNSKLTASDAELIKKRGELEQLNKQLELAKKVVSELDVLVRKKERARTEFESKLKESEKKLDEVTRSVGDQTKMQARIDRLEKDLKAERTKLDEANVTIVDLQGTKAKLADKVNKLQIESENKFAGIAMTGKHVVFLVDMSGSMDRTEENVMAPEKWGTVRDTVCKVMRSIPDLEKFQVILFSGRVRYLLEAGDWMPYEKEKSIDRVQRAMTAVKPAEDTNLYAGLEEAFKYRAKGMDTIYFFSDGLPTSGPGLTAVQERSLTSETERSAILSRHIRRTLATTWNRPEGGKRVRINSVGFFYESPDVGAFLWALSRENDGSFVGMSRP
jgi:predicted  nucleic acid-binding Zn-ribbon protein